MRCRIDGKRLSRGFRESSLFGLVRIRNLHEGGIFVLPAGDGEGYFGLNAQEPPRGGFGSLRIRRVRGEGHETICMNQEGLREGIASAGVAACAGMCSSCRKAYVYSNFSKSLKYDERGRVQKRRW